MMMTENFVHHHQIASRIMNHFCMVSILLLSVAEFRKDRAQVVVVRCFLLDSYFY